MSPPREPPAPVAEMASLVPPETPAPLDLQVLTDPLALVEWVFQDEGGGGLALTADGGGGQQALNIDPWLKEGSFWVGERGGEE